MSHIDVASVAALFADPSRAAMIELLLDGREHPVHELAASAGIGAPTATEHVSRLERGGVVFSRHRGRQRLIQLAGPASADVFEALTPLIPETRAAGLRAVARQDQLRRARTCYDHLAGMLGVAIADAAQSSGALNSDYSLGPLARDWFTTLGVEIDSIPRTRRPFLRVCNDWTERRAHLAGTLGAALCSAFIQSGWVVRNSTSRALLLTGSGEAKLTELGFDAALNS